MDQPQLMHPDDRLQQPRCIRRIEFALPEAVIIGYFTIPDDLRRPGHALTHELVIPLRDHQYEEELTDLYDAAQKLLNDALEDIDLLDPYDPTQRDEEDDPDDDDD